MCKKGHLMDEELNKILADENLDSNAKAEQIKAYVGNNFVPTKKYADLKTEKDNAYNTLNKEYQDYKQSKMTDEEKVQAEKQAQANELASLKKALSREKVTSVFKGSGLNEDEYSGFLDDLSNLGSEKAVELANGIVSMVQNQRKTAEEKYKDTIIQKQPSPNVGNAPKSMSEAEEVKAKLAQARSEGDKIREVQYLAEYQKLITKQK
jgi:uncharacterized protein YdaT